VDHGAHVAAAKVQAAPAPAVVDAHPALFAEIRKYPADQLPPTLKPEAAREVGVVGLQTVRRAAPEIALLKAYGPEVVAAQAQHAKDWQDWRRSRSRLSPATRTAGRTV
jgi:hypothetical protein